MITTDEIKKLANLGRIEVTDTEVLGYAKDFEAILGYVDQVNQTSIETIEPEYIKFNISREDTHPNAPGTYNETMLADAPESQDGFYKVPKIL
jgi:aspartyl-tRNA(Asn)/glutamyl-tRNA(Gln) amidotransferase subunit C